MSFADATRVLVIDQSHQPHRITSWRRAVALVLAGKAEVLESYDHDIEVLGIPVPAVVRLLSFAGVSKRGIKFSRVNVLLRDNFTCQYCRRKFPMSKLNYDHVLPRSRGGKTTWENIVTSCVPCNNRKADRTPEQAGMPLRRKPERPETLPMTLFKLPRGVRPHDKWATHLYWKGQLDEET